MQFRKLLFWLHLIAGCLGGVVILIMSFTGVILAYERQILALVERGAFHVAPGPLRLPVEELLLRVVEQRGPLPVGTSITIRSEGSAPVELNFGNEVLHYFDPYTGRILGSPDTRWWSFFRKVTAFHRRLGGEGEWRAAGKAVTGACTLAFLFLVLSGFYLWMRRPILWFRSGLARKARDFNWHNTIGFWTAIPLFFVILSALPISYHWVNELIDRVTGTTTPRQQDGPQPKDAVEIAGYDRLWSRAIQQSPQWQSIGFRLNAAKHVDFTIDRGDGGQPQLRGSLTLDRETAELVRWETFSDFNRGRQARDFSRFLHTGEALGFAGQTIAGLASLGAIVLVYTGLMLAWRRCESYRAQR